jgi:excisionase family DNA binding protein
MPIDHERSRGQLKVVLQTHQALEKLESALVEFEVSISEEATLCPQQEHQRGGVQLLSIPQLCQELGMGKSWIYRRLRSGEIPSVRLGRSIKVGPMGHDCLIADTDIDHPYPWIGTPTGGSLGAAAP